MLRYTYTSLKVSQRIEYKILSLVYNSLQFSQPSYLRQLFTIQPTRSTRSSACLTLSRPSPVSSLKFSNRSISNAAPRLWNELPPELRKYSNSPSSLLDLSPGSFLYKLKTFLFRKSYPD